MAKSISLSASKYCGARPGRWRSKRIADRLAALITREPFHRATNFWIDHDGSEWLPDPVWDKCFPKFAARDKRDAIGQYWDMYLAEAERLKAFLPEVFRIVETNRLNDRDVSATRGRPQPMVH